MTRCRYMNTQHTTYLFARPTTTHGYYTLEVKHVCTFCSGKGEYKTSEVGKVRR
jgi:hypothetical protein